jgi:DNA-binding SARP family transcriptional activator/predicted ATPase/DNA-binding transcriptional ArsR family regulator
MVHVALHITLLGDMQIATSAQPLSLPAPATARSLLAYLLLHHDTRLPRERLAGNFWPERGEPRARRALSNALWQVRGSLGPAEGRLTAEDECVTFHLDADDWLDVAQFERRLSTAPATPVARRLAALQAALALYRGDLLIDLYDDWCLLERERLRERYLWALGQVLALQKQQGAYAEALATAQRLVAADPLRESARRELMRLYYLHGRPRAALAQFERLRTLLAEELGVDPTPTSVALYREIAAGMGEAAAPYLPVEVPPPLLGDLAQLPFVGRRAERVRLLQALKAALQRHGGVAIVRGAAGVGKTRLVHEVIADAQWRGVQVGQAKVAPLGAAPPYQLLRTALTSLLTPLRIAQLGEMVAPRWLSALAPLFPALREHLPDLPQLPPLNLGAEWERLWEALAHCLRALAAVTPLLLVLEDVHWADNASLAALPYLAQHLADAPLLLLLTSRVVEAQERPLVLETLEAVGRNAPLTRVSLAPFNSEETVALLQRALGVEGRDAALRPLMDQLAVTTEGNALHLLESLKLLLEQGMLLQDAGRWRLPEGQVSIRTPGSVQALIDERLARLPAVTRDLLELVAVLGGDVDFRVLSAARAADAAILPQLLEQLRQRGLLRQTELGYRFEHDQIQGIVYAAIAPERRVTLHRHAGLALEAVGAGQVAALAHHFTRGAAWEKAVVYNRKAGDEARAAHANAEAASYYTQALAALDRRAGAPDPASRFELHLAREEVYAIQGEREAQAEVLATLEALVEQRDAPQWRAEVALRRAQYCEWVGDFDRSIKAAEAATEAAERVTGTVQTGPSARLAAAGYLQWGRALTRIGEYDTARIRLERALSLAREADLPTIKADTLRSLGNVCYFLAEYAGANDWYTRALAIYRQIGNRLGEAETLTNLGVIADSLRDCVKAPAYYGEALRVNREIGYRQGEVSTLLNFAVLYGNRGDNYRAKGYCEQALALSRKLGDRRSEGMNLSNLAVFYQRLGDFEAAQGLYEASLDIRRAIHDRQAEGWCLANMALLFHALGDDGTAKTYAQEALQIVAEIGARHVQGFALTNLGHALVGLGELEAARSVYVEALNLRRALEEHPVAIESLAGLARVSLAQGDLPQALSQVEDVLAYVQHGTLESADEPLRIYLTCYRVLRAGHDLRADEVLTVAHRLLQVQAAQIEDAALRRTFLENVSAHREILAAYRQRHKGRVTVHLPRSGVPLGRPLREDETVVVTWTLAAPEDDAVADRVACRRHRILRLLHEAADQGAEATVDDLAAALDVSARTIKRDLAALRAAGHEAATRGSRGT